MRDRATLYNPFSLRLGTSPASSFFQDLLGMCEPVTDASSRVCGTVSMIERPCSEDNERAVDKSRNVQLTWAGGLKCGSKVCFCTLCGKSGQGE
jgi:hypothetical protein